LKIKIGDKGRRTGIAFRTALLSWLVTIGTLVTFTIVIIPQQKRIFLQSLDSKAHSVAVALLDATVGSIVNDDYSAVVEHCMEILKKDNSLAFLVITRSDGFSLIHDRHGWRQEKSLPAYWNPARRVATGGIDTVPLFNRRVFHYAQPINFSGIEWGWMHVGLSLDSYDHSVATVYWRTGFLTIFCILLSLIPSVFYARRIAKPILSLQQVVKKVAGGNLSVRAQIRGGNELSSLATSINAMTEALLKRDKSLQGIRFAAHRFLSTTDWKGAIDEVLAMTGQAANATCAWVIKNHATPDGRSLGIPLHQWPCAECNSQNDRPQSSAGRWPEVEFSRLLDLFKQRELVTLKVRNLDAPARRLFQSLDVASLILAPIVVEESWWGVLGLGDGAKGRDWTDAEQDSLHSIADMLGAAITKQHTQDALFHAKEAAEAASRAKSQFVANMSHEIRTPMNGVLGMLDLLMHTELEVQQLHYAQTAVDSGKALLGIINDILDISKIEAGRLELEKIVFEPRQTIQEVVDLLSGQALQKGLKLTTAVASHVPRQVRGDPGRLRQVLLNIIGNAVKFTESGEVMVRAARGADHKESLRLHFEVQDTGAGLGVDERNSVFDPFVQADGSSTRRHGGTGLGLAISKQLVEIMGGEIGVISAPGEGATFWFDILLKKEGREDDTAFDEGSRAEHHNDPSQFENDAQPEVRFEAQVLVAEDNRVNQEVVVNILKNCGCSVEVVSSGELAVASWTRRPWDLILMDCQMPDMDGYAATRAIRKEEAASASRPRVPIIALTAHAMDGDRQRCLDAGMDDYLVKPFTVSQLLGILQRWIQKKPATRLSSPVHPERAEVFQREKAPLAVTGRLELPMPGNELGTSALTVPVPGAAIENNEFQRVVLVAEDNPLNQEVTRDMLALFDCRVEVVSNGKEALDFASRHPCDLILMDCEMPVMNGYEATRAIRGEESSRDSRGRLPIIAMTGHLGGDEAQRCLAAGMNDYLNKPFNIQQLGVLLDRWLPHRASGRQEKS
jgi:two-component system, sensor histidine kinase